MRLKTLVFGSVLALLFCSLVPFAGLRADSKSKSSSYAPDAHGLERQYKAFLTAYDSGDANASSHLDTFVLPDFESWFGQYFGSEPTANLKEDYNRTIAAYQHSLPTIMSRWPKGTRFRVDCERRTSSGTTYKVTPRPDAPVPVSEIPVQQYEVTFSADKLEPRGGRSFSQLINLVYVDGAFRFLGLGAYPFWSMPETPANRPVR